MNVRIFAGKGGVGKTTSSVSLALHLSKTGESTAVIDYDGGHSVKSTLGFHGNLIPNSIGTARPNLQIAVIENTDYMGITEAQVLGWSLQKYLNQFPGDRGIIPLADMVNAFFGVPTDVATLEKFVILVGVLCELAHACVQNVIIDVEPTAGLERLLSNAQSTARSLLNLKKQGIVSLTLLGAKWPHIAGYLKGDYIKHADVYTSHIEMAADLLRNGTYLIVSTPEESPVSQAFEVKKLVEKFGGTVRGYVINNLRNEPHEPKQIARLQEGGLPTVKIGWEHRLHDSQDRIPTLLKSGELIASGLL